MDAWNRWKIMYDALNNLFNLELILEADLLKKKGMKLGDKDAVHKNIQDMMALLEEVAEEVGKDV